MHLGSWLLGLAKVHCAWFLLAAAQPSGSPLELLQQERTAAEVHRSHFGTWCQNELHSQTKQRDELLRLRARVISSDKEALLLDKLHRESDDLARLLDKKRKEASVLTARQGSAAAALGDLGKQVEALTAVEDAIKGEETSKASLRVIRDLLSKARRSQKQATVEAAASPDELENEGQELEKEYARKAKGLARLRARRRAADVGDRLLLQALEDEDGFLIDLQNLCSLGSRAYRRLNGVLHHTFSQASEAFAHRSPSTTEEMALATVAPANQVESSSATSSLGLVATSTFLPTATGEVDGGRTAEPSSQRQPEVARASSATPALRQSHPSEELEDPPTSQQLGRASAGSLQAQSSQPPLDTASAKPPPRSLRRGTSGARVAAASDAEAPQKMRVPVTPPPPEPEEQATASSALHEEAPAPPDGESATAEPEANSEHRKASPNALTNASSSSEQRVAYSLPHQDHLARMEKDLSNLQTSEETTREPPAPARSTHTPGEDLHNGWQSLVSKAKKKQTARKHSFSDQTSRIADLVQTPTSYTAWHPEHSDAALAASAKSQLLAAEQAFDDERPAAFVQLSKQYSNKQRQGQSASAAAASLLLERYAHSLGSAALLQLAQRHLDRHQLGQLWGELKANEQGDSEAQAVKWCRDFEQDTAEKVEAAYAAHVATVANLTEAEAEEHLLEQEATAQKRVLRVVQRGSKHLSALLDTVRQRAAALLETVQNLQKQAQEALASDETGTSLRESLSRAEGLATSGSAEVEDLIASALSRRKKAEHSREEAVNELHKRLVALGRRRGVLASSAEITGNQDQAGSLRKHYDEICKWTLQDIERRRHKEESERDAIHAALAVLNAG